MALTTTDNLSEIKAREVDFVERFTDTWEGLQDVFNIMRPIKKESGTTLVSYEASVELEDGNVGEGEEIPYSSATITPVYYDDLTIEKYAKAVSIEAVSQYGPEIAIQKTDDEFLRELQGQVMDTFYEFLQTGTLTAEKSSFSRCVSYSIGLVRDKFKKLRKDSTNIITFVNTLDAYTYLGSQNLTVQSEFGLTYLQNFLGATTLVLSSEIPEGTVISTPSENIVLYYVDPADAGFKQLGLDYTVQGETNLIGFHANGNYSTAVGESFALLGMTLWAEYLDGIAIVTINSSDD